MEETNEFSMVERVAKAIYDGEPDAHRWPEWETMPVGNATRAACLGRARSAIEAMREPTEAMIRAPIDAELDIYWGYRSDGRPGGPEDVWRTMIDAALLPK